MAMHELNLKTLLENLDGGRVAQAFQADLRHCINDMEDRPGDDKDRTVTLVLKLTPVIDDEGHLDEVKGKFQTASKVPNRRSKAYSFKSRKMNGQPQLVFNDLSDDNVKQKTIDD